MNTYIALFRGINVGGKNILPMKPLTSLLESLGYQDVQTYIQSGNVVFRSKQRVTSRGLSTIRAKIAEDFGFEPRVLLLNEADLQMAIENNPFPTDDGKSLHFYFLEVGLKRPLDTEALTTAQANSEEFDLRGKVFYLYAPKGVGRSKLARAIEKVLSVPVSARNWNTVQKLAAMVGQAK